MNKHKITVFTPTYNRAHTLERLYRSLKRQNFSDFEWLVVDDGSSDNTKMLFDKWTKENNFFPINYYLKDNGGKHTAINFALEKANGELFFTADSDDYLTDDALLKVNEWASTIPQNDKFCGVVGNWGYSSSETPNTIFDADFRDANFFERYAEVSDRPIDGERAFVFFTDIHKKYKYPEYKNERFMTEAVTWNRMAHDGYKIRVFNDIIYIYKYLPGGLSLSGFQLFYDNPKGYGLWLKEKAEFLNYSYYKKLSMYYGYFFTQKSKLSIKEIAENIGSSYFIMKILYFYYKVKKLYHYILKSS